ncbi:MAG TPA: plastocyanin/azurin family copper-binding protein [Actinomycetes bacterium]|nr:plastocyanin/azurin family copper-binding protein [Actinomycetes bacterium]
MPTRSRLLAPLLLVLAFTLAACQSGSAASPADSQPVKGVTTVEAKDLKFLPPAIEVAPGTEVTWRFDDGSVPHNVKGDGFASKNQTEGTFAHSFDRPGEYEYTCTLHAGMDGRVVVTG